MVTGQIKYIYSEKVRNLVEQKGVENIYSKRWFSLICKIFGHMRYSREKAISCSFVAILDRFLAKRDEIGSMCPRITVTIGRHSVY